MSLIQLDSNVYAWSLLLGIQGVRRAGQGVAAPYGQEACGMTVSSLRTNYVDRYTLIQVVVCDIGG